MNKYYKYIGVVFLLIISLYFVFSYQDNAELDKEASKNQQSARQDNYTPKYLEKGSVLNQVDVAKNKSKERRSYINISLPEFKAKAEGKVKSFEQAIRRMSKFSPEHIEVSHKAQDFISDVISKYYEVESHSRKGKVITRFLNDDSKISETYYQIVNVDEAKGVIDLRGKTFTREKFNYSYYEDEKYFHFIPISLIDNLESFEIEGFGDNDFMLSVSKNEGYAFYSYFNLTEEREERMVFIRDQYKKAKEGAAEDILRKIEKNKIIIKGAPS